MVTNGQRWTEMVVYTQIQRALIEIKPLTDAEVNRITSYPYHYRRQCQEWNIVVPEETRQEFQRRGETAFYEDTKHAPRLGPPGN